MYLTVHLVDLTILSHRTLTSPRRTVELSARCCWANHHAFCPVDVVIRSMLARVPELDDLERGDTRRLSERLPGFAELDAASS